MRSAPILVSVLFVAASALAASEEEHAARRAALVREIGADARATAEFIGKGALDERVMRAMGRVPRHEFVSADLAARAYENRPLPIGYGQTISQPYIVALMTDLIDPQPGDAVLEVGTGSGYQAAVLAELVARVTTIEIIPELAQTARRRLKLFGFSNVQAVEGDGYYGWEAGAPYDGIVVTAAAGRIPPPLIAQLKNGGRMVIPVGGAFLTQQLMLVEKDAAGAITTRQLLPVRFVPLTGRH